MEQRVSLITLGVEDLTKARAFYEALGFENVSQDDGIVTFNLIDSVLGLYERNNLERDIGKELPRGSGSMTLSHNVRSKDEVDVIAKAAGEAGASILRSPHEVFWGGYIAYFEDPDGHIWEIAHNPFTELQDNGAFQWR